MGGTTLVVLALLQSCGGMAPLDPNNEPPLDAQRWSDPATWGGTLPAPGDEVTIPAGQSVLLDVDTPTLGGLTVMGALTFDRRDVALTSEWVVVHGALWVGSERQPFTHQARITLTDTDTEASVINMGTRGLMVMGGRLELHGAPPAVVWSRVDGHMAAGASAFAVTGSTGWSAGDQIALAPTDFFGVSETERLTLASVRGAALTTTESVATARWGVLQYVSSTGMSLERGGRVNPPDGATPTELDERAEVANLTRNIVIEAPDDDAWRAQGFGAHVMVMHGSTAHVDGVELRRAGQRGRLGRYPFHWHVLSYREGVFTGDTAGQYLRRSVVNESSNRGVVVHGTNGLTIADNVIYRVRGHAFFTEDAVEQRNVFDGNLVLHVRNPSPADALKRHEFEAGSPAGGSSGFWISNPDNVLTGNVVADTETFGFWMAMPDHPWGLHRDVVMRPNRVRFGQFDDNVTHTNRLEGLMFDRVEVAEDGSIGHAVYISTEDGVDPQWPYVNQRRFAVRRFSAWKNGRGAIWDRMNWVDIEHPVVADNAGRFFAGAGVRGVIRGGLVVGTSLNGASARAPFNDDGGGNQTPVAFATYNSTFSMVDNTVVNFPLEPGERSGAFATEDYYIRPVESGHTFNRGNLLVASHPGARLRAVLPHYTLSGALWDPHGTWGGTAGRYLVYDEPFFTFGQTPEVPAPGAAAVGAVAVVGPFYGLSNFTINQDRPSYSPLMALAVQRLDPSAPANVVGTFTVDAAANEFQLLANMRHFAAHRDGLYTLRFPGHATPHELEVRVSNMLESTDHVVVALQFDGGTTPSVVMARVYRTHSDFAYAAVDSLAALRASDGETYWQDRDNNLVWVHLRGGRWSPHWDQSGNYEPTADDDEDLLYEPIVLRVLP